MSERELFEAVKAHLEMFGWRFTHFRTGQSKNGRWATPLSGHPGFPDLVAVRSKELLFIELKNERGKPTEQQWQWLTALDGAGGESHTPYGAKSYVWRPSDLSSGLIERVLRGLPTDCRCPEGYPQTRDGKLLHTGNCPLPDQGAGHG